MKNLLREPLVHFLALGAVLFLVAGWKGGSGSGSTRIVVTRGEIEHLTAGFERTWQRPPTDAELKGLVDEFVKEEIAAREASAMGLDRDDTVVRRRLRQKFEFLAEEDAAGPPSDAELKAYLEKHADEFRPEPRLAFRQVYLNATKRGAAAPSDAARLLDRLRRAGASAATQALGDATLLPESQTLAPLGDVVRYFGRDFAEKVDALPAGRWEGPVASPFGLHLVLVTERTAPALPTLDEVRPRVEAELVAERKKERLDALYAGLLAKYRVTVEPAAPPVGGSSR